MKKVIAIYSIISWFLITLLLIGVLLILLIYKNNFWSIGTFCGLIIISIVMVFITTPRFEIDLDSKTVTLFRLPLIDPYINREKRHKIDYWNNKINLENIHHFVISKLTKEEMIKNLGSKYLFNKYLIVETKSKSKKYLNISMFSKKQIKYIVNILKNNIM